MKKNIIIGGILFLLLAVLPYSMQRYGRKQLAVSLEQPVFDLVGYQKGWNWLEYVQYFPFWKSETKKYQKCGLLEAKMRFFEDWADCEIKTEDMLEVWVDEHTTYVPYFDTISIPKEPLSLQFIYWKSGLISLDSLPEHLHEQIIIVSDYCCADNKKKWQPFVDWTKKREIDLTFQDSILSSYAIRSYMFQWNLDYNVNYINRGYSL
ncbi:MAG: hypothetical protein AB8E82_04915 [Aureispira sp.]